MRARVEGFGCSFRKILNLGLGHAATVCVVVMAVVAIVAMAAAKRAPAPVVEPVAAAYPDAAPATAGMFVSLCRSQQTAAQEVCADLIGELVAAHALIAEADPTLRLFCAPRTLGGASAVNLFVNWIDLNPRAKDWHYPDAVMAALIANYSCQGRRHAALRG